jgi:hypothetical protein
MDLVPLTRALSGQGYSVTGRDRGVTVYRRQGSSIVELAAEGGFTSPPARVRAALLDYPRHHRLLKNIAESRVLARGKDSLVVYQRLRLPLISDRDYTLIVSWGADGRTLWLKFCCGNSRGPNPRPSVIRVSTHEGGWLLLPIQDGRSTWARYQMRLDLAGSLPRWMARSGAGAEIPDLFEVMRALAR